ncbi:MAG: hypothetical protein MAG458_00282 [Nitrosopumilus sp.]|nr:hypothetical protein [Nitrosopumilus sp.]
MNRVDKHIDKVREEMGLNDVYDMPRMYEKTLSLSR